MDAKELAGALNGIEYSATNHMTGSDLMKQAKASGLVVAYGYSDDLLEFDGAIHDEASAPGEVRVDAGGILPSFESAVDSAGDDEEEMERYIARKKAARTIEAVWAENNEDFAWTLKTDIPHETFTIVEDGVAFSRGIVFALADLVPANVIVPGTYEEFEAEIDWRARYMREVEGLNNEGDPIGGEPAMGLRQVAQRASAALAASRQDLIAAQHLLGIALNKQGGAMSVSPADYEAVVGKSMLGNQDPSTGEFVLSLVDAPAQVQ